MTKLISYIHLIFCTGGTVFVLWYIIVGDLRGDDFFPLIPSLIITISGIYMFFIYRNRKFTNLEEISMENEMLERQIKQKELMKKLSEQIK